MAEESGASRGPTIAEGNLAAALPFSRLVTYSKSGLSGFIAPPNPISKIDAFTYPQAAVGRFEYSSDGKYLAMIDIAADVVRILDGGSGEQVQVIDERRVQAVHFSPNSTFIATFRQPVNPEEESKVGNVTVWNLSTLQPVLRYWQRNISGETWPSVQWNADESVCARLGSNEVYMLDGKLRTAEHRFKLHIPNLSKFALSSSSPPLLATLVPTSKGAPANVKLYKYPNFGGDDALVTKAFYKADSVRLLWNAQGTALLILTSTDVDTTGKSYYGLSQLYYVNNSGVSLNVPFEKEGPVHDVQWSPTGDEFCVIQGTMPPKAICFNAQCEPFFDFGTAPRNTISWAPGGRMLMIGGFGGLPGDMDFWDRDKNRFRKLNSVRAHHPVVYGWSPCCTYFLTATTHPRLRLDNGYVVYKYNGVKLFQEKWDELYNIQWRPAPPGMFRPRPPSSQGRREAKEMMDQKQAETANATKPAVYRPPGARENNGQSEAAAMFKREEDGPRRILQGQASSAVQQAQQSPQPQPQQSPQPQQNRGDRQGQGQRHREGGQSQGQSQSQGQRNSNNQGGQNRQGGRGRGRE